VLLKDYSGVKFFAEEREMIMEDKELKKRFEKITHLDKNGEPIYKIDVAKNESGNKEFNKKNIRRVRARIIL
jgi:hypothetical protein